ncbi:MAG: hypothetical protein INQ03_03830 [Candidatus Heimdallarchaeota archaeon]|nr:hypothetical protein [Candidatus Heimdallarchaeota archaeon]
MRTKILFIILSIILFKSMLTTSAALPWTEGDTFSFTETIDIDTETKPIRVDQPGQSAVSKTESEIDLEISEINENQVTLDMLSSGAQPIGLTIDVTPEKVGEEVFKIDAEYKLNADLETILTDVSFSSSAFTYLVDPDWELFNQGIASTLDPDTSVGYDLTKLSSISLEDLMDEAVEYKFLGEKDLNDAFDALDSSEYLSYSFSADFSGNVIYSFFDKDDNEWVYIEYEVYTLEFSFDFDDTGVLKQLRMQRETKVTTDYAEISSSLLLRISNQDDLIGNITNIPAFEITVAILVLSGAGFMRKTKSNRRIFK